MSGGKFSSQVIAKPVVGTQTTSEQTLTAEGGIGYRRDAKSELFLLAVSNFVAEDTFYETANDRDNRFLSLVHQVTAEDPRWVAAFIPFLRNEMNMRSASIVAAIEYGRAHQPSDPGPTRAEVAASAMVRADEPAEALAYWRTAYGRTIPSWLKRGINRQLPRLYTEKSALKYDGTDQRWRFGDVLAVTHPAPVVPWRRVFYRYLSLARYGKGAEVLHSSIAAELLPVLTQWAALNAMPEEERRHLLKQPDAWQILGNAGMTWERLSSWLGSEMDATAWEAVIPSMGYMARLRNLRNFEQAGVNDEIVQSIASQLSDPEEVRQSRQFPFRFYSAYKQLESERFSFALERALELSVSNIPQLSGRTLIMIDCSGSMNDTLSGRSKLSRREAAGIFGASIAKRCEQADIVLYGSSYSYTAPKQPVLRFVASLPDLGGTYTWEALRQTYRGHDRVIVLTDEQAHYTGPSYGYSAYGYSFSGYQRQEEPAAVLASLRQQGMKRFYTYNLAGYEAAQNEQGKDGQFAFGGLSDAAFKVMAMLETTGEQTWPFEVATS